MRLSSGTLEERKRSRTCGSIGRSSAPAMPPSRPGAPEPGPERGGKRRVGQEQERQRWRRRPGAHCARQQSGAGNARRRGPHRHPLTLDQLVHYALELLRVTGGWRAARAQGGVSLRCLDQRRQLTAERRRGPDRAHTCQPASQTQTQTQTQPPPRSSRTGAARRTSPVAKSSGAAAAASPAPPGGRHPPPVCAATQRRPAPMMGGGRKGRGSRW